MSETSRVYCPKEEPSDTADSLKLLDYNPSNPHRKHHSMKQFSSWERLNITKLAASRTRTSGEIASLYNIKVQVVYDLMKDAKKKKTYFVKKKEVELRREKQHAAVV